MEENSFQTLAALWDDMPLIPVNEDMAALKAARGSKTGFVKLVFNFLIAQDLFFENHGRYYIKPRFPRSGGELLRREPGTAVYHSDRRDEDAAY